ncbi:MAG: PD40 domain-containing protein, partial [Bacteroidales bacterium]|nr:PD40 domain-containing protein [Bacteroidales bacterium]
MKPIVIQIILVLALIAVTINTAKAQTAEQLYQKGLTKEEGEGALQEAIDLYNQVADNPSAEVSLRAKALLHIGLCYEKLGTQEAIKAYQRLVNNFPTQKNEVAIAKERLNTLIILVAETLPETPLIPEFTKIKIPSRLSWTVSLSPDGKTLAHISSDNNLWTTPLSGNVGPGFPGKPVQVNTGDIKVERSGLAWSRDGKWIAFNDLGEGQGRNQTIHIVSSGGGMTEKIIKCYRDARVINYRLSLSPDGKRLAHSMVEDNEQHIYITEVDGSKTTKLVEMQAREPVFSPDGKMIAYVQDRGLGREEGGLSLWTVPASGGKPRLLAEAAKASSPVWSPDGRMIAYLDAPKNKMINIVEIPDKPDATGNVTSIEAPESAEEVTMLAGWTNDDKIGLLITAKRDFSIFTLPAEGGQAAIVSAACYALQPRWTNDGRHIIYVKPPEEGVNRFRKMRLYSVPSGGGTGIPLPEVYSGKIVRQLPYQSGNRISPDGTMILTAAYTAADTAGAGEWPNSKIWKLSLDGKEAMQITNKEGRYADMCPSWSPDGSKIAFLRAALTDDQKVFDKVSIYTVSSEGGEPVRLIPEADDYIFSPVWSPDGEMIAYLTFGICQNRQGRKGYLRIINVSDGKTRTVCEVPTANVNVELVWSPNGKEIACNADKAILVIKIEDGKTREVRTGLTDAEIWHLDWSPDGKQFVFAGGKGGNAEFWLVDNFLPLEKLKPETKKKDLIIRKALPDTDIEPLGSPSPDGRYISYTDWDSGGNLGILDLKTKERKLLTDYKDQNEQVYYSMWSPDGKQIAYFWWKSDKDQNNLSIVDVHKGESRDLLISDKYDWIELGNWSSDGKHIVATFSVRGRPESQIMLISTVDGSTEVLKTFEKSYLGGKPWLSPDNRFVAFDLQDENAAGNSDIYLLSL